MPKTWLSIDLDYITGDCRSGSAHCHHRCPDCVNGSRGIKHGTNPPDAGWKEREREVHALLKQPPITKVVVRDCHADINPFLHRGDVVYHLDEHADIGYFDRPKEETLHCANWGDYAEARGVTIKPIIGMVGNTTITGPCNVFICLSIPYTNKIAQDILGRMLCRMPYKGSVDFRLESRPERKR